MSTTYRLAVLFDCSYLQNTLIDLGYMIFGIFRKRRWTSTLFSPIKCKLKWHHVLANDNHSVFFIIINDNKKLSYCRETAWQQC